MAPIKFENNMKESLEKRRLQPEQNSWEKLSQRLDTEKNNNKPKPLWWIGVAASIILLISVGLIYLNDGDSEQNLPIVVENEINPEKLQDKDNHVQSRHESVLNNDVEGNEVVENTSRVTSNKSKTASTQKFNINKVETEINDITAATRDNNTVVEIEKVELSTKMTLEEEKIREVVAEIQRREHNEGVSEMEIDSMLKAAQRALTSNEIKKSTKTVSADELLRDVEADLDKSFRNKVFDALKNGYESVKTAVAERNQ